MSNPLAILFAGESHTVTLLNGKKLKIAIRAHRERFMGDVLAAAEHKWQLVTLCAYFEHESYPKAKKTGRPILPAAGPGIAEHIPAPTGFTPLPLGFTDNLSDESLEALYEAAKRLNFARALIWAESQIRAKKELAPVHEATMAQVLPLVLRVIDPLMKRIETSLNSTPKSPPSPAGPASSSSTSP